MAQKRRSSGGRVTARGTRPGTAPGAPPTVHVEGPSPRWVPVLMSVLLAIGAIVIFMNYLGWLPGATDNIYLGVGLLFILAGIITATRWR